VRNQGSIEHDSIPGHTLWSVMDNTSVSCGSWYDYRHYKGVVVSSPGHYKGQAMGGEKGRKGMLSWLIVLNIMKQPFSKF
jgi:hypothetical protein